MSVEPTENQQPVRIPVMQRVLDNPFLLNHGNRHYSYRQLEPS